MPASPCTCSKGRQPVDPAVTGGYAYPDNQAVGGLPTRVLDEPGGLRHVHQLGGVGGAPRYHLDRDRYPLTVDVDDPETEETARASGVPGVLYLVDGEHGELA